MKQTTHAEENANFRELANRDELEGVPVALPLVVRIAIAVCVVLVICAVVL